MSFGRAKYDASNNIQEVISLGSGLMWNNVTLCGGRMGLKILVRDSYDMCKSLKINSNVMFAYPLVCWDYEITSLIMRVHTNHCEYFICSKYFLYIHPKIL